MPNSKEMAGGVMMIGVEGHKMTPAVRKLVQTVRPGGVIFFRPNFSSVSSFRKLIAGLEKAAGKKLLTAVDHEGGRVIHLADGVTVFPDNLVFGNTGKENYVRQQGMIEAAELRKLGIVMNLAPTVDVLGENYSPNIGIRSYGKDPALVSKMGSARIKAMQKNGVAACAKHFPGQGHSAWDAHFDLPVLSSSPKEIENVHLAPFRAAIKAGVEAVMSSHPIYPQMDASGVPATFSKRIIRGLLREKMEFEGLILSDDLEMGALKNLCTIGESAVRAVEAGHDMVLVCHEPRNVLKVFKTLTEACESGRLPADEIGKSLARIEKTKRKYAGMTRRVALPDAKLPQKIAKDGVRRLKNHDGFHFKKGSQVTAVFPRLSELSSRILIEREMMDEERFAREIFKKAGLKCEKVVSVSLHSSDKDEEDVRNVDGDVVFFCYDAHQDARIQRMLKIMPRNNRKAAAVLLRNPYDSEFVSAQMACVQAYGFRACQIKAALGLLVK